MEKVEIGRYYKNIYTGRICRVTGKVFYNIKFDDEDATHGLNPRYCHYKRFRKNWVEVPDTHEEQ